MFERRFWKDLAERVVASGAGGALAVVGTVGVNVFETNPRLVVGVAAGSALAALLKGLAARRFADPESASLVRVD